MPAVSVRFEGPFFDEFNSIMPDIIEDCRVQLGNKVLERVQYYLNAQIKHPTPYYETQIIQQTRGEEEIVHDRGIVYGPWLEGTSRRNSSTRFKGYASFRKATADMQSQASGIVSQVIGTHMGSLGGTP